MPETAIGLCPDVGASSFLNRLPPGLAMLLGLTGLQLRGIQVRQVGLASHYVQSSSLPDLERALSTLGCGPDVDLRRVDAVLRTFEVNRENSAHFNRHLFDHVATGAPRSWQRIRLIGGGFICLGLFVVALLQYGCCT
jgi:enoyl-CoA hydratase/carnithine racemase